ncbi:MAG: addiction module antidote protein [Pseudomonadota bacterium]|uniref:addiction module antidote protein n=1 Tax=Alloalcanivorax venustensis TaxID=172371 RepID=UPI002EBA1F46|nr:addiction module antidote protein [Pseudomonadota bacterium]
MSRRQPQASISHDEAIIEELRADREFAIAYLQAALEELDDADNRAAGLLALRDIAEAYGGMAVVARDAGITREALYRALSPKGNPTLKTLLAVLHAMDMRLSVTTGRTQGLTPPQGNTCRPA